MVLSGIRLLFDSCIGYVWVLLPSLPSLAPGGVSTLICCLLAITGVGPRLLVGCFVRTRASSNKITKSPACTLMKKKKASFLWAVVIIYF